MKQSAIIMTIVTVFATVWMLQCVSSAEINHDPGVRRHHRTIARDPPGTKTFSKQKLRDTLKELFEKQRMELHSRMAEEEGGDGEEDGAGGGGGERIKRAAEGEDKKVLTMEQEDRLAAFIGEVMICQNIPGLSLSLVKDGVGQGLGYGVADMETARPVDKDTMFGIGSNSKLFASITMAYLMSNTSQPPEKRLTFATPVNKLIPELKLPDDLKTNQTTYMDIMTHRLGVASGDLALFAGVSLNVTASDMCRRLQFLQSYYPIRERWFYSNIMFVVIERVCEVTTGKSFTEVVNEAIFQPLQMNNTAMLPEAWSHDNVALPYILRMTADDMFVQQDRRLFDIHPLQSAGSIMSSAKDMTSWLKYLLDISNRASTYVTFLQRLVFPDRIPVPEAVRFWGLSQKPVPFIHVGYGMGVFTSFYKGEVLYWHTGDLHGYDSHLLIVPGWESGVYIGVNGPTTAGTSETLRLIAYFALELLQGRDPWVNVTLTCPEGWETASTTPSPDPDYDYTADDTQENALPLLRPAEDYVGIYGHGLMGDLTVAQGEEGGAPLYMTLGRMLVADLLPTADENILKLAVRPPVSETTEFEGERAIVFKHNPEDVSTSSPSSSKNTTGKEGETTVAPKPVLTEIHFRYSLYENYIFQKSVRFDTAIPEDKEEEEEKEEEEDNIPNSTAPSRDPTGGAAVVEMSSLKVLMMVVMVCLTVFV